MKFKCECGKEFDNPQSFNGHKSNCKIHLELNGISYDSWLLMKRNQRKLSGKTRSKNAELKKLASLSQWIAEEHKCECCGKIMVEKFGSGRFCSRICANSRHHSEETKQKISKAINQQFPVLNQKICKICGKPVSKKNISGLCKSCYGKNYPEEVRQKQSKVMSGKPRWNIHRNQTSFAEKFWIEVLQNNNITFSREVSVKYDSLHCYFLDFYIEVNGKKLDLEIDGKQHLDRLESDKVRDNFLRANEYIVYRVSWNNITTEPGKLKMKNKIDNFLAFYNKL